MSDQPYEELFSPLQIRGVTLSNRVVAPPMVQHRPITSPEGLAWYKRLAAGGAGLVIVECTSAAKIGRDFSVDALNKLSDTIHSHGAAAAIQLLPCDLGDKGGPFGPEGEPDELTTSDVDAIIDEFARAAEICAQAGFDGIEPHGAHGYILNRFFMPDKNHRDDEYGGTLANRCRLAVRIVSEVRRAAGEEMLILYRHTATGEAYSIDDSLVLAEQLALAGLDVLDISPARKDIPADLAAPFKAGLDIPVIAVKGMEDPEAACEAIRQERCDLVAVGRQLIADAQWPRKVKAGKLSEIVSCQHCKDGCWEDLRQYKPVRCVFWSDSCFS